MAADEPPLGTLACGSYGNPFSDGEVRLAFGEKRDERIVHISEVPSGLACDCTCPACGCDLVAHKGANVRHHFKHRTARECRNATETAVHKFAKQILNEYRELVVPEVRAEIDGESRQKYREKKHSLDDAVLEKRLGDIVPDVIVRKAGRELIVEIAVTHRCDAEKIKKIRALGIAAVEIDLSGVPVDAPKNAVIDAILNSAPREWLFNPKLDLAHAELRADLDRRAANLRLKRERDLERLCGLIDKARVDQKRIAQVDNNLVRRVVADGYRHAIGRTIDGDYCFCVGRRYWQAAALNAFVLTHLRKADSSLGQHSVTTKAVFRWLRDNGLIRSELLTFIDDETETALREKLPDYQQPYHVVQDYLQKLEEANVLRRRHGGWAISNELLAEWARRHRQEKERADRREYVLTTVSRILERVPREELAGFEIQRWFAEPRDGHGISFHDAITKDDARYWDMRDVLASIDGMFFRSGKIADGLLGLPLASELERQIESRRVADEAKRLAAQEAARQLAEARISEMEALAARYLGSDGRRWTWEQSRSLDGRSPAELAYESADGLARAQQFLGVIYRDREDARMRKSLFENEGIPKCRDS